MLHFLLLHFLFIFELLIRLRQGGIFIILYIKIAIAIILDATFFIVTFSVYIWILVKILVILIVSFMFIF